MSTPFTDIFTHADCSDGELARCNGPLCKGITKPISQFLFVKGVRKTSCKSCKNYRTRQYVANHKEQEDLRHKLYRAKNLEKEKERHKRYRENNKEMISQKRIKYDQENSEKIRNKRDERLKNLDNFIKYLIVQLKKKDKQKGRETNIDLQYVKELIDIQRNKCKYSGADLIWSKKAGIHQVTIDRISSNLGHVKGNCQLVTVPINHFKSNLTKERFESLLLLLRQHYNKQFTPQTIPKLTQTGRVKIRTALRDFRNTDKEKSVKDKKQQAKLLNTSSSLENIMTGTVATDEYFVLDFDIEYIEELRKKCNDRCALSNLPVIWEPNHLLTASIDRIDSKKNHCKANVQITAWYVNCLKKDLTDDAVKQILTEIVQNYDAVSQMQLDSR